MTKNLEKFAAQLGELTQHQLNADPNVFENSEWYLKILKGVLERNFDFETYSKPRYLEVACFRMIMGYQLAAEYGFESTLFDINDRDLELGRQIALDNGLKDTVDRVAGDFHNLPFSDEYFDFAYVSASLHHTLQPETIISEMMRVLKPGGYFYCQREPAERMFCFYLFNANRPDVHTPMEAKLFERDTLRLFSSPFHGARNADVFSRVENDKVPLSYYYDVFAKYGDIVEQVLYHDGLLTKLDNEILQQEDLPVNELTDFIYEKLVIEVDIMEANIGFRERLLGYRLPTKVAVMAMARRVANALKARPEDKNTVKWRRAMVEIFGGNLRFLVRRNSPEPEPEIENKSLLKRVAQKAVESVSKSRDQKYKRACQQKGQVKYDDEVYKNSALQFWNKLLPDVQTADPKELFNSAFAQSDWRYKKAKFVSLISISSSPILHLDFEQSVVLVARYRILLDEDLYAANLRVELNGQDVNNVYIPQEEDRVLRVHCEAGRSQLKFYLYDLNEQPVSADSHISISILQCIPVIENTD